MYTVRKVRNLSKLKTSFGNISENLMTLTQCLLKYGLILIENMIKTLDKKENLFDDNFFNKF